MDFTYTEEEIKAAQEAIDFYPNASSFWDSSTGQDVLDVVRANNLKSTNTNRERCRLYAQAIQQGKDELRAELGYA